MLNGIWYHNVEQKWSEELKIQNYYEWITFTAFPPIFPNRSNPQVTNSNSEVNKSLVEVLKMALRATNGKLNLENLNLSFRKEDRSFSGYLPPPKVIKMILQICSSLKTAYILGL